MKNTVLLTAILCLSLAFTATAQNPYMETLFDRYSSLDDYTSVDVAKGLFDIFANIESGNDKDLQEFKDAVKDLEGLKLLAYTPKKDNPAKRQAFYEDVIKTFPLHTYKELMVVNEGKNTVKFYAKNDDSRVHDMVMLVNGAEETLVLTLDGFIDLSKLAKLGSTLNILGSEHFKEVKKK
jgi:hypothetical protein